MLSKPSRAFLRYVLWADAISCLACGLLQVAFLASRTRVSSAIIWLLIAGNFLWGLACVGMLLANDVHPHANANSELIAKFHTQHPRPRDGLSRNELRGGSEHTLVHVGQVFGVQLQ
jgi:hypothetical protein